MILEFEDKISGIRCNLPKDLKIETTMAWILWKDVPDFVRKHTWFGLELMDIEILKQENGNFDMRPQKYLGNATGEIKDTRVSEKVLETAWVSLSMDDQIKVWLYNNRKDLWNELLEKFGTEENVYNYYIRFNH